jgi:uncharacterized protein (TIGR02118 family)
MVHLSVLFPKTNGSHFDMDYYLTKHLPMVKAKMKGLGMIDVQVDEGVASPMPGQAVPFAAIALFTYTSIEDLQKALATHSEEIMKNIPNFTDVQPILQISRIVPQK